MQLYILIKRRGDKMSLFKDKSGQSYDEVKYHTRQKHRFLEKYLEIWTQNVGKGQSPPTLDIVDLYSSSGSCFCSSNEEIWDGSSIISAKCLQNYPNGRNLILNSYSDDEMEQQEQVKCLDFRMNTLNLPPRIKRSLFSLKIEDAITEAIKLIDPRYPSFWILDPYQPQQLPWAQLQRIIDHNGSYRNSKGDEVTRLPELFIILITESLQRSSGKEDQMHFIDVALGLEREIWLDKLDKLNSQGMNTRQAMIEIYAERYQIFMVGDQLSMKLKELKEILFMQFFF